MTTKSNSTDLSSIAEQTIVTLSIVRSEDTTCSIPKLLHPYLKRYFHVIKHNNYDKREALAFLHMVKRKERKLEYAFKQKEKGIKNKYCAQICEISIRWFQQLYAEYKMSGTIPELNKNRRPRRILTEEEKEVIEKALKESLLEGAVKLRLHIKKHYGINIPHNKIHEHLLRSSVSKEDPKKKKQRTYKLYQREYSFSLAHLDWHDSKVIPGKKVCAVFDDRSRKILSGGEFNEATARHTIDLFDEADKLAYEMYSAIIREVNTDRGSQFYCNKYNKMGEKGLAEFELHLKKKGKKFIPSRRNHPQTNGKEERWFRTYEENRHKFKSFKRFVNWYNNTIHLGLSRKEGITPNEIIGQCLQPGAIIGLFFRRFDQQ